MEVGKKYGHESTTKSNWSTETFQIINTKHQKNSTQEEINGKKSFIWEKFHSSQRHE